MKFFAKAVYFFQIKAFQKLRRDYGGYLKQEIKVFVSSKSILRLEIKEKLFVGRSGKILNCIPRRGLLYLILKSGAKYFG